MRKIIVAIIVAILLVGCSNIEGTKNMETDATLFKKEYESLNNKVSNNKEYRSLEIDEDNPFEYKSASEILDMIDNGETFAVYFGFASCPWCRSVIPSLIDVSDDLDILTIYYVDIKDIRDVLKLDDDGNIITEKEGTEDYYKLLEELAPVLDDYILTDEAGNEVDTKEKRIYAPNIISVVEGVATKMTTGISDKQTDAYVELTSEMKEDSYEKIKHTIECITEVKAVCSVDSKC